MLAIDYDRYLIFNHCPLGYNERKYVFWGICMSDKVKYIGRFHKFQKSDYWVCRWLPLDRLKKN